MDSSLTDYTETKLLQRMVVEELNAEITDKSMDKVSILKQVTQPHQPEPSKWTDERLTSGLMRDRQVD